MTVMQLELPLVDFGLFRHGNPAERQQAAEQLVESFQQHGFVRLKNHGVSKEFVQEIWKWVCSTPSPLSSLKTNEQYN